MQFDFTQIPPEDRYRLLTNFVGPRPIALVATRADAGHDNAAPMSFFNVFSHEPALVIIGFSARSDGSEKDTIANIRRTGEFCVNMVDLPLAEQMIVCGVNFAVDVDELDFAGLSAAPCRQIAASRISTAPCAMECRVERIIDYPRRAIVFGEVVEMHVREDCLDENGRYVDPSVYQPVARLHADNYIVSDRQFELKKPAALAGHEVGQVTANRPTGER
jgi:flavin reductase (DIM6/NTAB) family NADH-FMN oxidoreductase RutF